MKKVKNLIVCLILLTLISPAAVFATTTATAPTSTAELQAELELLSAELKKLEVQVKKLLKLSQGSTGGSSGGISKSSSAYKKIADPIRKALQEMSRLLGGSGSSGGRQLLGYDQATGQPIYGPSSNPLALGQQPLSGQSLLSPVAPNPLAPAAPAPQVGQIDYFSGKIEEVRLCDCEAGAKTKGQRKIYLKLDTSALGKGRELIFDEADYAKRAASSTNKKLEETKPEAEKVADGLLAGKGKRVLGNFLPSPLASCLLSPNKDAQCQTPQKKSAYLITKVSLETASQAKKEITIYSASWCPSCTKEKNWLQSNYPNLKLNVIDIDNTSVTLPMSGGIPQTVIGNQTFVGFDQAGIEQALTNIGAK